MMNLGEMGDYAQHFPLVPAPEVRRELLESDVYLRRNGGHINPAVAVANLLRERRPDYIRFSL